MNYVLGSSTCVWVSEEELAALPFPPYFETRLHYVALAALELTL